MKLTYLALPVMIALAAPALAQQSGLDESHLNAIDQDGNGSISKQEFDTFTEFAFEKMDTNNNSTISPDELDDHLVGDALSILDDDENGIISEDEFARQMEEDFAAADKDGDGILN